MNKAITWIIVLGAVLIGGWAWWTHRDAAMIEQAEVVPLVPPRVAQEPQHPVSDIRLPATGEPRETAPGPEPEPLPALASSDAGVSAEAERLLGSDPVARWLVQDQLINRLVATIDSLTSRKLAPAMLPWQAVPGSFRALSAGDEAALSPANAQRYAPLVDIAGGVDSARLVAAYLRYYPLFQESYRALGYPDGHFNDRLVAVLDHLLETPAPRPLVALQAVEGVYEFADPALEARSAGQKMLLRLSPEQYAVVVGKLREVRGLVAAGSD